MRLVLLACLAAMLASCGGAAGAPLVAGEVRITAPRPGTAMSAGYLRLENPGRAAVTLTRVTSPQFGRVDLHRTVVEDGVSKMRPVPELVIAPGESVTLEPGGLHLMLMQPRGDGARISLQFWSQDTLLLTVESAAETGS